MVTDLETRISALLAQAGEVEAHEKYCAFMHRGAYGSGCTCDHASRVLARQARMVAAGIIYAKQSSRWADNDAAWNRAAEVMLRALRDGVERGLSAEMNHLFPGDT